jgi:hypothetical protein
MRGFDEADASVSRANAWRRPTLVAAAALAAAVGVALMASRGGNSSPRTTLLPEPLAVPAPTRASLPPAAPPAPASVAKRPKTGVVPQPSVRARPSLAEETAALDGVQRELERGDDARALELLDRYERGGSANRMSAEATLLRIEALARAGRRSDADALARSFIAKNPGNPLVDRARAIVSKLDQPSDAGAKP